jgi:hypothetical protein
MGPILREPKQFQNLSLYSFKIKYIVQRARCTMYFSWLFLQKFNFSHAQSKLPEDGPNGPKHVGANIRHFNVNFNILYV